MPKARKDWNLASCECVTTKNEQIKITKPKPAETTVTVIDTVNDADALLNHINAVEKNETPLTVSDILKEYINDNIVFNAKVTLRNNADPEKVVDKALDRVKKLFPNLSEEQVQAMAAMLKASAE